MNNYFQPASAMGSSDLLSALAVGSAPQNERSLVSDYLSIAKRRKWLILSIAAAFAVIGLVVTLFMTPLYTASATLEIQRESSNFTPVKDSTQPQNAIDSEFYQTQYGLLKSRASFFEKARITPADGWFVNGRPVQTPAARDARVKTAGGFILKGSKVEPDRMSRLVDISFTSPDPQLSKRVVDAWSQEFIQTTLERRFAATSYARSFLEDRLQQLRSRIDESQRALVGYASRENIVNIPRARPAPTPPRPPAGVTIPRRPASGRWWPTIWSTSIASWRRRRPIGSRRKAGWGAPAPATSRRRSTTRPATRCGRAGRNSVPIMPRCCSSSTRNIRRPGR